MKTTGYVIAIMLVTGLYVWALALYGNTIVQPAVPAAAALAVALALWFPLAGLWRRIMPRQKTVWQLGAHMAVTTGAVLLAIMALNYYGADRASIHEEIVTVDSRYVKERQRTRRINRRIYTASGEKYNVYYMVVRFGDGRTKEMRISASRYRRLRVGSQISLPMNRGLLGMMIIDRRKTQSDDDSRPSNRNSDGQKQ